MSNQDPNSMQKQQQYGVVDEWLGGGDFDEFDEDNNHH